MQIRSYAKKSKDYYGVKLIAAFFVLTVILAYTSLYAVQNYYSSSIFSVYKTEKKIYLLESSTLKEMYRKRNMDYDGYKKRIEFFYELCNSYGYAVVSITSDKLVTIGKNSIVLALDMMALSSSEISSIDTFVESGGKLLFNFTSGFLNSSLTYQENNLVTKVAGLHLSKQYKTIKFDKKKNLSLSTRLLSPITKYLPEGFGLSLPLYDALPIFKTNKKADAYLTTWVQTHHPYVNNIELTPKESGLIWHGSKGKGKWVYFSFPSYVFSEVNLPEYSKLFHGMLSFLENKITVQLYPYIDSKNAVFISEDTEYKFENLKQFYKVSKKYHFPVTVFCVARLALEHTGLMKQVGSNNLFDIASHSYEHKKIVNESNAVYKKETIGSKQVLNVFSKKDVIGFRPPREELDDKLINFLQEGNYKYILTGADNRLYPYFKDAMLIISKHATDDYSYLIRLDWSSNQILSEMKKELNTIIDLDGIYTLSTHTHLLMHGTNVKVIDKFMSYVKSQEHMTPLNGRMIYDRISKHKNMSLKYEILEKKYILTLLNNNDREVENLHYEINVDSSVELKKIESEMTGVESKLIRKSSTKYLLTIKSLKPKSQIVLFINYNEKY